MPGGPTEGRGRRRVEESASESRAMIGVGFWECQENSRALRGSACAAAHALPAAVADVLAALRPDGFARRLLARLEGALAARLADLHVLRDGRGNRRRRGARRFAAATDHLRRFVGEELTRLLAPAALRGR